jgi:DNA modification methylase
VITRGDARALPLADGAADLILTSPPYLNAIDYMRARGLTLVWLGYPLDVLRDARGGAIGTERGLFETTPRVS